MSYSADMNLVATTLVQFKLDKKPIVHVCNPATGSTTSDAGSAAKFALRKDGTGEAFFHGLGQNLVNNYKSWGPGNGGLDCVGMTALLYGLLTQTGKFGGNIDRGLIGKTIGAGHVFLILHDGCCDNPTMILDLWSYLYPRPQGSATPASPLVPKESLSSILPTSPSQSMLDGYPSLQPVRLHTASQAC